jgi:hypothetical protein
MVRVEIAGNRRGGNLMRNLAMTDEGLAFLKCAFAAPDFESDQVAGVPDMYSGRTITKKHRNLMTLQAAAGFDYFYLVLPTPGVAFWACALPAGTFPGQTTVWNPIYYPDTATLFPPGNQEAINIERFRIISNCFEMICTSNATQWNGSLTSWKFPVTLVADQDTAVSGTNLMTYSIKGLQSAGSVGPNNFCTPSNMGVYLHGCHADPMWNFNPIYTGLSQIPQNIIAGDYGQLSGRIIGFGNMEAMITKISAYGTSFTIKSWSCVEYMVNTSSSLYDFTRTSPEYDPVALMSYRHICTALPVAVNFFQNDNMWQRILRLFIQGTKIGSALPGTPGLISTGLNMVGEGLGGLFL